MEDIESHEASLYATSVSEESHQTHNHLKQKLINARRNNEGNVGERFDMESYSTLQDDVYKILSDKEDVSLVPLHQYCKRYRDSLPQNYFDEDTLLPAYHTWLETSMVFMSHMYTTTSNFCKRRWNTITTNFNALPLSEAVVFMMAVIVFVLSLFFLMIAV